MVTEDHVIALHETKKYTELDYLENVESKMQKLAEANCSVQNDIH